MNVLTFRMPASKARRWSILAAAVGACLGGTATHAVADLTGFSGFAGPNTAGSFPTQQPGYSSNGSTFYLTDGGGGEAVSGFSNSQQLISSFNAVYTTTANGSADGTAFIIQNSPAGTSALGAGGGGLGYTGPNNTVGITNSAAVYTEYYFAASNLGYTSASGFGTGGVNTGYTYTGAVPLNTGHPIQTSVTYNGTNLVYTFIDTTLKTVQTRRYTGVNLAAAVGSNTAYVGFSGATGGATSSQNVSNFTFTSAPTYSPIPLTASSFNQDLVVEAGAPQPLVGAGPAGAVTATMDAGTLKTGNTWYEKGYNTANASTGLPASGSTFTSQNDSSHTYTMQSYTANNALLIGANASSTSGTLTLSTPKAYRSLSLLAASGNNDQPTSITINYANGTVATVQDQVVQDWFGAGQVAWNASGRVAVNSAATTAASFFNNVGAANPNLWEVDFPLPDTTDAISSLTLADDGGTGRTAIFALSGASSSGSTLVYSGTGTPPASFDTAGSLNFQVNGTPTPFSNGSSVLFDDTAAGSTTVTVQAGGVTPGLMTFNNSSKAYVFNGGAITAVGGTFNGSSSVTFNDAVTFTGATSVGAGTVVVGATGSLNTSAIAIANGASVNVAAGGKILGTPSLIDNGTLNLSSSATVGALTGGGAVVLNGTTLTAGAGTNFTGSFAGAGGTFNLSGGTYNVTSLSMITALSNINVGLSTVTSTLLVNDASGQLGFNAAGGSQTLTLGPSGVLTSPPGGSYVWGGNIVLNASTGAATISIGPSDANGNIGYATIVKPITGAGPLVLGAGSSGGTINLNASSTYTGETRISLSNNSFQPLTVNSNAENALSPNAGINFLSNGIGPVTVELNGHNQSAAYLSGAASVAGTAFDNNGSPVTLTITNVNTGSGVASFGVPITGSISVLRNGTGNQLLAAANTYSGTTTITAGTLTAANSSAFSNSTVTLNGGKLGLSGVSSLNSPTITSFANFQTTQGATTGTTGYNGAQLPQNVPFISADSSTLYITSNEGGEANSAFLKTPVTLPAAGFYAKFTYLNDEGADGLAFVLQNDPRGASAVGATGGALGYGNGAAGATGQITPSLAIQFNIYNAGGTGFGTNGVVSDTGTLGNINFGGDPNPLAVSLVYNAQSQTLTETVTDTSNGATGSVTYGGINAPGILGGNTAYLGFTGGTGGSVSAQSVSNLSFGSIGNGPVSIGNAVVTLPGTTSGIELNVTNGFTSGAIGSLTLATASKVVIDSIVSGTSTHGVLFVPTLTMPGTPTAPGATIDVQNNAVVLPGATLATITAYAKAGFAGGTFNGSGITSSTAAADSKHLTAVGVIENDQGGTPIYTATNLFDGAVVGTSDILVKYTYFGDANLDGKVDGSDYSRIDNGYLTAGSTGWYNGDFNYDGKVDGSDYTLIDNAYNRQTVSLATASLVASPTALVAGPTSAVPEPTTIGLLLAACPLLARRKR